MTNPIFGPVTIGQAKMRVVLKPWTGKSCLVWEQEVNGKWHYYNALNQMEEALVDRIVELEEEVADVSANTVSRQD